MRLIPVLVISLLAFSCGSRPEEAEIMARPSLHALPKETPENSAADTVVVADTIAVDGPEMPETVEISESEPAPIIDDTVTPPPITIKKTPAISTSAKPAKRDTTPVIIREGPCNMPAPSFYRQHRPTTRAEALESSKWAWQKAVCFRNINQDSCTYYINVGLDIYENASLFTLRAAIELERRRFSAAKVAAEISINRSDHWDKADLKRAFAYRIAALRGLLATYPSSIIQSELENAENEYQILFGSN